MCKIYAQTDPILFESRSRSIRINGVITTIRLENLFWTILTELANDNNQTTNQLIAKLYEEVTEHLGETANFASFLRVSCLRYQSLKNMATTAFNDEIHHLRQYKNDFKEKETTNVQCVKQWTKARITTL